MGDKGMRDLVGGSEADRDVEGVDELVGEKRGCGVSWVVFYSRY